MKYYPLNEFRSCFSGHTDLRVQEKLRCRVRLNDGVLVQDIRDSSCGVSARVYRNRLYGFSSSADISEASVKRVIAEATKNAETLAKYTKDAPIDLPYIGRGRFVNGHPVREIDRQYLLALARDVDEYIVRHCPGLVSRTVLATTDSIEKDQITDDAFDANTLMIRTHVIVYLVARGSDGNVVALDDYYGGRGYADEIFKTRDGLYAWIDQIYSDVMRKRDGVYTEAGVKDLILCPDLAGMLAHEAVGHTVEADLVRGGGVAKFCMNEQVASELVTLTDFAHTAFGKECDIPIYVDDEGTPGRDVTVIDHGILRGYMHDRLSAAEFGAAPTGNARAYDYIDEPVIRMRNTCIMPGTSTLDDMIAAVDDGYLLAYPANGQADATGEFMFGAGFGMEIKKGKLARPLRGATLSGYAFDLLKSVDMLSSDLVWRSGGMCGKKTSIQTAMGGPAIKCRALIGGR